MSLVISRSIASAAGHYDWDKNVYVQEQLQVNLVTCWNAA